MADELIPAAMYARMSTEDQKYSIANQAAVIHDYAAANGYRIVATYSDPGISGLDLKHRPGLKSLLDAVVGGSCSFETILVLDVSRWGRFQDIDESAHYEFLCRSAGVRIQYCAEPFVNDLSAYSNLVKAIKRTMAAEYSRELGVKVFRGQARLAALGYKQGGVPQLGLRRLLVDKDGNPKQVLNRGERKSLASDRIVLVPGPARERHFVNNVFQKVADGIPLSTIARELRRRRIFHRNWDQTKLLNLLTNPQYVGTYVYGRLSVKLKAKAVHIPSERWVVAPGALPAIVPKTLFDAVQERLSKFTCRLSNEELLRRLKALWEQDGFLTIRQIDKSRRLPSVATYRKRFGELREAYSLIGYPVNGKNVTEQKKLAAMRTETWNALKANLTANGARLRYTSKLPYNIHASGLPIFNMVFAYPIPGRHPVHGPMWQIRPPRRAPIGRSVVALLSWDRRTIREFVITRGLRKNPVRRFLFTLPVLTRFALARFRSPSEFHSALRVGMRTEQLGMAVLDIDDAGPKLQ